jgi:hypothetical protein
MFYKTAFLMEVGAETEVSKQAYYAKVLTIDKTYRVYYDKSLDLFGNPVLVVDYSLAV